MFATASLKWLAALTTLTATGAATAGGPATLSLTDVTVGRTWAASPADLFVGHSVRFDLTGCPGEIVVLLGSAVPPPASPPVFGGVPLAVDPASMFVFFGPQTIGGTGASPMPFNVPSFLPAGVTLYLQGALLDPTNSTLRLTGGLAATTRSEPFQTLLVGASSAHPLAGPGGATVVTSAAAWNAFWAQHAAFILPVPPPPAVDFSQHAVLAVFVGQRPSSGYAIAIEEVRFVGSGLEVTSTERLPGAGCGVLTVITEPFQFVTIPAPVAAPVQTWTRRMTSTPCL